MARDEPLSRQSRGEPLSHDARLRAYAMLLVPGFVGHAIQLTAEDEPWTEIAAQRYWITPGWHLALHPGIVVAIAVALALAVIVLAVRRDRASLLAVAGIYAAHYLTYPFRIRNHMTTMLVGLVVVSTVWLAGRRHERRVVDRVAVTGLAAMITVQYVFAGLHKINANFLDPSEGGLSGAVSGLTTFWIYGDLGSRPPIWAVWTAILGTIVIEIGAPIVALAWRRAAIPMVIALMLFHVPHVACMDVADYPMIASAFFPALIDRARFAAVARHLGPSRHTVAGALIGVAIQLWFMPWWGRLTIFGMLVLAIWGWGVGAAVRSRVICT